MGLLNRYILREIAVPSGLALALISFLAVGNELRERIELLPIEHITMFDVARLTVFLLPALVSYVVPITYMMGILLAFGRLTQQDELTAMKAAGIPLKRVIVPVVAGGALLSGLCFLLQDQVQPLALARAGRMIYEELPGRVTLDLLPAGVIHQVGDWRVYIGGKDPETGALLDVQIFVPQSRGPALSYHAKAAQVVHDGDTARLRLDEGFMIMPQEGGRVGILRFPEAERELPARAASVIPGQRRMQTLAQCFEEERRLAEEFRATRAEKTRGDLVKIRQEISDRISLPLFALVVGFLAAPLAARGGRAGRSYSFAIGGLILLTYFPLQIVLEPRGARALGEFILRGMIPNLALFAAGCWAIGRVDRV